MAPKPLPPVGLLRKFLRYEPETGRLSVIYGWRRAARRSATYGSTERRRSWDFLATVALWIAGMIHNLAPQGGQE